MASVATSMFRGYATIMATTGACLAMPFDKIRDGWDGKEPYAISKKLGRTIL